jgi:flavodoxin I
MSRFVIIYLTLSGNTKKIAEAIAEGAMSQELSTTVVNFQDTTPKLLCEAEVVGIGSPTYMHTMHGQMKKFMDGLHSMHGKKGVAFGSYGWSGESAAQVDAYLKEIGVETVAEPLKVKWVPNADTIEKCRQLGLTIASKMKENV